MSASDISSSNQSVIEISNLNSPSKVMPSKIITKNTKIELNGITEETRQIRRPKLLTQLFKSSYVDESLAIELD